MRAATSCSKWPPTPTSLSRTFAPASSTDSDWVTTQFESAIPTSSTHLFLGTALSAPTEIAARTTRPFRRMQGSPPRRQSPTGRQHSSSRTPPTKSALSLRVRPLRRRCLPEPPVAEDSTSNWAWPMRVCHSFGPKLPVTRYSLAPTGQCHRASTPDSHRCVSSMAGASWCPLPTPTSPECAKRSMFRVGTIPE